MIKQLTYSLCLFFTCAVSAQIVFEDHFDGDTLNTTYWNFDLGNGCPELCGWGNNELQYYSAENVFLKNGYLHIKTQHVNGKYTSAKITTKQKVFFTYGTVEVRAKLPVGQGVWPAIWLLGENIDTVGWPHCGEIDMMEYVGKEPQTLYTSLHNTASFGNTINSKKTHIPDLEEGFHTYTMQWTKDAITFKIDNTLVYTYAPAQKTKANWPYISPFYLIINTAVGGNFGGPKVDNTIFPQEFIIDYVKITKT